MVVRTPIVLPHETDAGIGSRARIGMIILQSDYTLESEVAMLPLADVAINHSRIPNDLEVTPETLTAMAEQLPTAAALLPAEFKFDAIAYGCTSASTLIGDDGVSEAIHQTHPGVPVTNPILAATTAFKHLGVSRIGVVTPYSAEVTMPIIERFEKSGFEVTGFGSFLVTDDLQVAKTSPKAIANGLATVAAEADCDAFFVSCTSVRMFAQVETLEKTLGKPVVSSNLALAWHMLRLAGIEDTFEGFGSLLGRQV